MALDFEAVYAALATRIQTCVGSYINQPVSRRLVSYDQVPMLSQPAVFCVSAGGDPKVDKIMPAIWHLEALVEVYARADEDPGSSAEPMLNIIIGAIASGLERQATETVSVSPGPTFNNWTTLGGLVLWALPGKVTMWCGADGRQGVAQMQIVMTAR
jgi:hypothetical protein